MKKQLMFGLIFLTVIAMLVAGCQTKTGGAYRTAASNQVLYKFYSARDTETGERTLVSQEYGPTSMYYDLQQTKATLYEVRAYSSDALIGAGFTIDDAEPPDYFECGAMRCLLCFEKEGIHIHHCEFGGNPWFPECNCNAECSSSRIRQIRGTCGFGKGPAW